MRQVRVVALIAMGALGALGGAAGSPQDGDPEGLVARAELKDQFTIALPVGWSVYNQAEATGNVLGEEGWSPQLGLVIFSSEEVGGKMSPELLAGIDTGEVPSFFVDRRRRFRGSSCAGFGAKAEEKTRALVLSQGPSRGGGKLTFRAIVRSHFQPPSAATEPMELGGCKGVSVEGAIPAATSEGLDWRVKVRAVSDENFTYLFTLRNTEENYAKNIAAFDSAMATVRLSLLQADRDAFAKIEIEGVSSGRRGDWINIRGRVKNLGSTTVDWVKVACAWLDSSGKVRGTDFTFAVEPGQGLAPGGSSAFQMMMRDERQMTESRCYVIKE